MDVLAIIVIAWIIIGKVAMKKRRASDGEVPVKAARTGYPKSTGPGVNMQMPEGAMINAAAYGQAVPVGKPGYTRPVHGTGGKDLKKKYRETAEEKDRRYRRLEDRQNDWLARQIREEAKWKSNSCFDPAAELKRAHEKDCDARSLKREHASAHRKGRY